MQCLVLKPFRIFKASQVSFFSSFEEICASNLQGVDADLDVNLNAIWIAVEVKNHNSREIYQEVASSLKNSNTS